MKRNDLLSAASVSPLLRAVQVAPPGLKLKDLSEPTGGRCRDSGMFVAASPNINYFGDADTDGKTAGRKIICTGFGTGKSAPLNGQARGNGR